MHPYTDGSISLFPGNDCVAFAGPLQGKMLMVGMDAHSKWPEVILMENTTAAKTVNTLC